VLEDRREGRGEDKDLPRSEFAGPTELLKLAEEGIRFHPREGEKGYLRGR